MKPQLSTKFEWEMKEFTTMVKNTMKVDRFLQYKMIEENWVNFFACYLIEQPRWQDVN